MKSILKIFSLLLLLVFSFYYTDKISTIVLYKSDLMNEIISNKSSYEVAAVEAIISGSYIVPGISGQKVNEVESYYNMKQNNTFNESKLIFSKVYPKTSIENNKNLIINKANAKKKAVALIMNKNESLISYSINNKIKISVLTSFKNFDSNAKYEQINHDFKNFTKLDTFLRKYKLANNICIVDDNNDLCEKSGYYQVLPSYFIDNTTIYNADINSGDIIYITDDLSLKMYKILISKILFRGLDIVYLSNLIME